MNISESARCQMGKILAPNNYFRVQVQAGGCSGFAHEFLITEHMDASQDVLVGQVCMDPVSADILQNAVLDWQSDLSGSQFVLNIPEATTSCGCGKSFSLF